MSGEHGSRGVIVFAERENDEEKRWFTKAAEELAMAVTVRQNPAVGPKPFICAKVLYSIKWHSYK